MYKVSHVSKKVSHDTLVNFQLCKKSLLKLLLLAGERLQQEEVVDPLSSLRRDRYDDHLAHSA